MNSELFPPALLAQLDKIGQLFVWRRKTLRDSMIEALQVANRSHEALALDHQATLARLQALNVEHAQLTELQASTVAELSNTCQTLQGLQNTLTQAQAQHQQAQEHARLRFDNLSVSYTQLVEERNGIEAARLALEQAQQQTRQALEAEHTRNAQLTLERQALQASLDTLNREHERLTEHQATTAVELNHTQRTLEEVQASLALALDQHQHQQQQAAERFETLSTQHSQLEQARKSIKEDLDQTRQNLQVTNDTLLAEHARNDQLLLDCQAQQARLDALNEEHQTLSERQAATVADLNNTRQAVLNVQASLAQALDQHQRAESQAGERFEVLSNQHQQLEQDHNRLQLARQTLEQTLEQAHLELRTTGESLIALQQAHGQEQQQHAQLADQFQSTWTRFQLISRLLAAKPRESAGLARFRELLDNDYMTFADGESCLGAEAKALRMLQSIEQELALLVGFPDIHERTIVGIVGGFSSGKSEFINSFIRDPEVRLPVGMQPVTAIPSYVLATDQRMIRGYSANGGHMELDVAFYKNISHAFINSFSFDLKSLMPFMCVGVQMAPELFSNICFIDTPGYNPPATAAEHSQGDKRTAIQFAQQCEAIIWLIGLDANGTVPVSDLDFIHEIGVEQRSVYVVLTKADLKPEDEIEEIMDEVQDVLQSEGINVVGVSAYSSTQRHEIAYRDTPLLEYFSRINQQGDSSQHLEGRLQEIFTMYEDAIQTDINGIRAQKTAINGLRLDCLEVGGADVYGRMFEPIAKLDRHLGTALQEGWLKESRRLLEDFREAVRMTAAPQKTQI